MDRKLNRKSSQKLRWSAVVLVVLLGGFLVSWVDYGGSETTGPTVNIETPQIFSVVKHNFTELITVRGNVVPENVVYLDAIDGGQVKQVHVDEGEFVEEGEPIVVLSNTALQLEVISREAQVSEQLNNLRNTRLQMETDRLDLERDILEVEYQLGVLKRRLKETRHLLKNALVAKEEVTKIEEDINYFSRRLELAKERRQQNEKLRQVQLEQLTMTTKRLEENLRVATENLARLEIKAHADGYLTFLDAEVGEYKAPGARIGQIDDPSAMKVSANIDEFYLYKVSKEQSAVAVIDGRQVQLIVTRVYPQVTAGQFKVDFAFVDDSSLSLNSGQSLTLELKIADGGERLAVPRGALSSLAKEQTLSVRQAGDDDYSEQRVRLGAQHKGYVEVVTGMQLGDQVKNITNE
ncbi:efflux RND transporter periplasmic adaptor subunit [Idiomarina sp. HP20-50]|uniref:efflux RND transporter periplasmic adaptor subunit n=1 Tax=Idiomarina sp. HP20-50 TaxID=3070813 RepID=UPI00294AE3A9|nr:HlyD family efflux transporter periplasmic adaptor subunit [Idiomarina sp. HP20-50]MDV6316449.1 HlyD family efflux transporter periplasmic adaptor subunit [Idiomarina sp. HP20-50]